MKALVLAAALTSFGMSVAVAQNQTPGASSAPNGSGGATVTTPSVTPRGDVRAGERPATSTLGTAASDATANARSPQTGDHNQAVATTDQNAAAPARGANSFTEGQARSRIESNGFADVSELAKDSDGIWRGKAMKDGQQTQVWVDYRGNVGKQ